MNNHDPVYNELLIALDHRPRGISELRDLVSKTLGGKVQHTAIARALLRAQQRGAAHQHHDGRWSEPTDALSPARDFSPASLSRSPIR